MFFSRKDANNGATTDSSKPTKKHNFVKGKENVDTDEDLSIEEIVDNLRKDVKKLTDTFDRHIVNDLTRYEEEIKALKDQLARQNEFIQQVVFKLLDKPTTKSAVELYQERKEKERQEEADKKKGRLP